MPNRQVIIALSCMVLFGCVARGIDAEGGSTACEIAVECEPRVCHVATACELVNGVVECDYEEAAVQSTCDLPESSPGTGDGICSGGLCLDPGPTPCTANSECESGESCQNQFCTVQSDLGGSCDVGDSDDCAGGLVCDGDPGICVTDTGGSCSSNSSCLGTCVASVCTPSGTLGDTCDVGDASDCVDGLACDADNAICALGLGESCAANRDCLGTCVAGQCTEPAVYDGSCDPGDNDDCDAGLVCTQDSGICLRATGESCAIDAECFERCIDSSCAAAGAIAEACDPDDDDDCAGTLVCQNESSTCRADVGASCANNDDCDATCIGSECASPSELYGACDVGEDADCESGLACGDGQCRLAHGTPCTADSQCAGTCLVDTCGAKGIDSDACVDDADCVNTCLGDICGPLAEDGTYCDDDADCAQSPCNNGVCGSPDAAIYIVEMQGHHADTCASISELEFYNNESLLSAYATDDDVYDSTRAGGEPYYWTYPTYWNHTNLFDGDTLYGDNIEGGRSSTLMFYSTPLPGPDHWGRFAVFVDNVSPVTKIRVAYGSSDYRIPYFIRIYRVDGSYDYDNQVVARSDDGLTLLWTIEAQSDWATVGWVETTF